MVILATDYIFRGLSVTTNGIRKKHRLCHVLIPDFKERSHMWIYMSTSVFSCGASQSVCDSVGLFLQDILTWVDQ